MEKSGNATSDLSNTGLVTARGPRPERLSDQHGDRGTSVGRGKPPLLLCGRSQLLERSRPSKRHRGQTSVCYADFAEKGFSP
ncbi:hypothetical protein F2P81_024905 [Scophthalmus maximus]|uniref:Uncharacterized protein n=1 Tax=Scophthalmus maximus TaxID=52904 RepID=A0A6A4RWV2_SCOMX|nr:hypothetical protein F2P81_024905 [Scophthalmus maximus]